MAELPRINFSDLNDALLRDAEDLVAKWLPGGRRVGREYVCGSLSGGEGRSCSINLINGKWADFQSGEAGNDLTSLFAAIHGMSQGEAARELQRDLGWNVEPTHQPVDRAAARATARPEPKVAPAPRTDEGWQTQRPVPPHAPKPTFRHMHRKPEDIEHVAEYRTGDDLHGYVVRFRTSDGGKDPIPHTWCVSARDSAAKWHWKQFDEPRPLYFPGHQLPNGRTVILAEGEKKSDALQAVLEGGAPGVYCVASWPGGCKAWPKTGWDWLQGCSVLLWPDGDAKREPLSKTTRDSLKAQALKQLEVIGGDVTDNDRKRVVDTALLLAAEQMPLLAALDQPGMKAMLGIGALLRDQQGCDVQLLPIPAPGTKPDGWDCGDAINGEGWDFARVMGFLAQASALPSFPTEKKKTPSAPDPADVPLTAGGGGGAAGGGEPRDGLANAEGEDDAFHDYLEFVCEQAKCKVWDLGVNRKLLITALAKAPALEGCLGYNELTNAPGTVRAWPWRTEPGQLAETDDLRLGDWLCRQYKLKAASRAALAEAIDTVADMRRFHPIRDWLQAQAWDGKHRSDKWLMHVLGMDPTKVPERRQQYLALMGRYMLMGLVARVMQPGVKFDYSPVFEGPGGIGKSTFVKELVGAEFFSDTHFDIGNGKDGMEQLEGLWAYELSELTAFKRADSEQIKQFFSSTVDRFRGAYGKFVQPHKRQCVIFCTTNKRQYLYDLTGNRRFWPVWIDQPIKLAWLRKWRGQLFAEALQAWKAGDRFAPTREEEEAYFVPEQELRLVETTVQSKLYEMLTRDGAPATEGTVSSGMNQLTTFVTLHGLAQALGTDAAKSTSLLESQIRGWLESNGWRYGRETAGQRRRGYFQPTVWPPAFDEDEIAGGAGVASAVVQPLDADSEPARADGSDGISDDEPF